MDTVGRWSPPTRGEKRTPTRTRTHTHLETDTRKRKHVALARDGTRHTVVLDEREDQLRGHPPRRPREQGRPQLGSAHGGVGERELLDDRRQPEIRNQRVPLVADEDVGLWRETERRSGHLERERERGKRTPLRSPWITTGFMLWR